MQLQLGFELRKVDFLGVALLSSARFEMGIAQSAQSVSSLISTPCTHLLLLGFADQPALHPAYALVDDLGQDVHDSLGLRAGEALIL